MKLQVYHGQRLYLANNGDKVVQDSTAIDWKFENSSNNTIVDPTTCNVPVRIIDRVTGKCLQSQSLFPVETEKRQVFLAPIQIDNQSQFWIFEAVPNYPRWFFIVNQMPEKNGTRNLCLDVACERENGNAEIITYHKKRSNAKTKNQWWALVP